MEWTVAIGVDTHKEAHVAVALDALGAQLDSHEISATPAGYSRLLSWASRSTSATERRGRSWRRARICSTTTAT
jgi:hypothetical protein